MLESRFDSCSRQSSYKSSVDEIANSADYFMLVTSWPKITVGQREQLGVMNRAIIHGVKLVRHIKKLVYVLNPHHRWYQDVHNIRLSFLYLDDQTCSSSGFRNTEDSGWGSWNIYQTLPKQVPRPCQLQ